MSNYITPIISAVIIAIIFKLLAKLFPLSQSQFKTNKSFYELESKYKSTKNQGAIIGFIIGIGLTACFFFGLRELSDTILMSKLDSIVLVKPEMGAWLVCSMFLGLLFSSLCVNLMYMNKLGENWNEFLAFVSLWYYNRFKFDYIKVSKYVYGAATIIIAIFTFMLFDWYTSFEKDVIKVNNLLSFGTVQYDYNEVIEIRDIQNYQAPNGNIKEDRYFIIAFKDGVEWNSRNKGIKDQTKNQEIIDLVSNKSRMKPLFLEFDLN